MQHVWHWCAQRYQIDRRDPCNERKCRHAKKAGARKKKRANQTELHHRKWQQQPTSNYNAQLGGGTRSRRKNLPALAQFSFSARPNSLYTTNHFYRRGKNPTTPRALPPLPILVTRSSRRNIYVPNKQELRASTCTSKASVRFCRLVPSPIDKTTRHQGNQSIQHEPARRSWSNIPHGDPFSLVRAQQRCSQPTLEVH